MVMNRRVWYYIFCLIIFVGLSQVPRIFFDETTGVYGWTISRAVFWGGAIIFSILWIWMLKDKILKIWENLDYRLYIFINIFVFGAFLLEMVIYFIFKSV